MTEKKTPVNRIAHLCQEAGQLFRRLDWDAPPPPTRQDLEAQARQALFKKIHRQLKELESA